MSYTAWRWQADRYEPCLRRGPSIREHWSDRAEHQITSDPEQGIGKWSDDDIKQAITSAIRPDGTKLAGPMPYDWYAKMTPSDLGAIVAFMRTIKPMKVQ